MVGAIRDIDYDEKISVFTVNFDSFGRSYATELNGRIARFEKGNMAYKIWLIIYFIR